jgi:hypothetical protein
MAPPSIKAWDNAERQNGKAACDHQENTDVIPRNKTAELNSHQGEGQGSAQHGGKHNVAGVAHGRRISEQQQKTDEDKDETEPIRKKKAEEGAAVNQIEQGEKGKKDNAQPEADMRSLTEKSVYFSREIRRRSGHSPLRSHFILWWPWRTG